MLSTQGDSVFLPPLDPDKWGSDPPYPCSLALESVFLKLGWFLDLWSPGKEAWWMTCFCWVSAILLSGITKDQATRMGWTHWFGEILTLIGLRTRLQFGSTCGQTWAWATLWLSPTCVPTVESLPVWTPKVGRGVRGKFCTLWHTFLPSSLLSHLYHRLQAMCQTVPWDGPACLLQGFRNNCSAALMSLSDWLQTRPVGLQPCWTRTRTDCFVQMGWIFWFHHWSLNYRLY